MVSRTVDIDMSYDFIRNCSEMMDDIKGKASSEHIVCKINKKWGSKPLEIRINGVFVDTDLRGLENLFGYEIIWDSETPENQIVFEGRYREL